MECYFSTGLVYLRVYFLDLLVCDGLSYDTRRLVDAFVSLR